jgi:hypothetical protein
MVAVGVVLNGMMFMPSLAEIGQLAEKTEPGRF